MRRLRKTSRRGFTTIEIILSLALLGISFGAVISSLIHANVSSALVMQREQAASKAAGIAEQIMAIKDETSLTTFITASNISDVTITSNPTSVISDGNTLGGKIIQVKVKYGVDKSIYYEVYWPNG